MKLLKKAQAAGMQGFVLSIITVAIVLAIGLLVLTELTSTAKTLEPLTSVVNDSVTLTSNTGSVGQSALFVAATQCQNLTGSIVALGGDCNVSSSGVVTTNPANFSGIALIDYSHYTASAAYNSTGSIIAKLATVPTWLGIVIIVSLAFIVLSFFLGKRQ
jgi:hypothetical protein